MSPKKPDSSKAANPSLTNPSLTKPSPATANYVLPASRRNVTLRRDPTRVDPMKLKLGKQDARHDPRNLMLASYIKPDLPMPPPTCDLTGKVQTWGMMKNDDLLDCTCAAAGHLLMMWTANTGSEFTPTDDQIVAAYAAVTGYNPQTNSGDNGAVEVDVLNYWRQTGIAGHQIGAYMALEPANHTHIMDSVNIFQGCYIGLLLPKSAQPQIKNHQPWSVPSAGAVGDGAPKSWGGHAVPVVAYDQRGLTCITWGAPQTMTWEFWEAYCEEAYAILSEDYLTGKKETPNGFSLQQLQDDLSDLK